MLSRISNEVKIFFVLFVVFIATASGNIDSIDAIQHILLSNKIALHGRAYFLKNEVPPGMSVTKKGDKYIPIVNAFFAVELMPGSFMSFIAHKVTDTRLPHFPFEPDYIIILYSNFLNGCIMALAGVMIYKLTFLINEKAHLKWYFIPLVVLSTNLFPQAHENFAHPSVILYLLLTVYFLLLFYKSNKLIFLSIASLFFAFLAASYNITFVYILPPLFLLHILKMKRNRFLVLFTFALLIIPGFISQILWNSIRYGNLFSTGYTIDMSSAHINTFSLSIPVIIQRMYGLTFAPNKGLFINNPILAFSFLYAIWCYLKKKKFEVFTLFFIALSLVYLVMYSSFLYWHGDESYGPRYLAVIIPIGLILLLANVQYVKKKIILYLITASVILGIFIQLPGILIPSFSIVYLAPSQCKEDINRYFDWKCSPIKVGWSHIVKRRIKETITITGQLQKVNDISLRYPNPPKAFRTIYPDPLFDAFSTYKIKDYRIDNNMLNDIYSFTFDIWWIKALLFKNIVNR